jgi:hypothetical protein
VSASEAIARLRELRAKATAGKWEVYAKGGGYPLYVRAHRPGMPDIAFVNKSPRSTTWADGETNAAAIVAAMNSLDALLECAEAVRGVEQLLGEYIDKNGTVDVKIALAFETSRAALQALAEGGGE